MKAKILGMFKVSIASTLLLLLAAPVGAAVVFDNGVGSSNLTAGTSDAARPFFQADEFSFSTTTAVTSISWRGAYAFSNTPSAADDFTIAFYADVNGLPATSAFESFVVGNSVNRTSTGLNIFGFDVFGYSATISPLLLAANTVYWISIYNNTVNDGNDDWFWLRRGDGFADAGARAAQRALSTDPFIATREQYDFQLRGSTVPEPGTLALLGLGLAGLGLSRRRKAN